MGSRLVKSLINCTYGSLVGVSLAMVLATGGLTASLTGVQAHTPAFAVPTDGIPVRADTTPVANELQKRVEETAAVYNESLSRLKGIEEQITNNQSDLDTITEQLVSQRTKSSQAAAELYRMQRSSNTFLELLFSSQSISDLAARLEYITRLQDSYFNEINRLSLLNDRLDEARESLVLARSEAQVETVRAQEALVDAKAAREEARLKAEADAAAQAAAANMPVATSTVPPTDAPPDPDDGGKKKDEVELTEREAYVEEWASRINSYLGSHPLGGFGKNFAEAAWNYGVDPRVAPAISVIESGGGKQCFLSHNAWGWGSYSWPDWPTAIDQYVAGFSRGYGYTITLEGAKRYAPPSWESWYPAVVGEINSI